MKIQVMLLLRLLFIYNYISKPACFGDNFGCSPNIHDASRSSTVLKNLPETVANVKLGYLLPKIPKLTQMLRQNASKDFELSQGSRNAYRIFLSM